MLNVRHIFRLCKQSAQISLGRPAVYFSSNADDSSSKSPPNNGSEDNDSLDALLNATYSSKSTTKPASRTGPTTQSESARVQPLKSKPPSSRNVKRDTDVPQPKKSSFSGLPIEELLNNVYQHSRADKGSTERNIKPQEAISDSQEENNKGSINLALKRNTGSETSADLLDRVRKIAQEVAGAAGPKSNEVAQDLINKLQFTSKTKEDPLNINELTFEDRSKDSSDKNLDLLRNRIVSEEQIYKITPHTQGPKQWRQSQQTDSEFREPWLERKRRMSVAHDLDISLYPKRTIGIFKPELQENLRTKSCLHTTERLEQRDLNLSHSFAPRNWFEQCIQWTDQGKLWHFPINNEQGLEEEAKTVSFTEHIFLEDHLEGWCPTFGPVRHFMELVCLGLSKNPYLSVEEKVENIMWYRDYFDKHREILEAAGTLDPGVTKVPALEAQ